MSVDQLAPDTVAALRAAPLTYAPVSQTSRGPVPGYGWLRRSRVLDRRDFDQAACDLLSWQLQARAGLRVAASDIPLRDRSVTVMRLGFGPVMLRMPCRVVEIIDEPDVRGFTYGTLPGHPEAGEERFELHRHPNGALELTITAYSRPATRLARLGGPISRRVQGWMTERYLRSFDRPGAGGA